MKRQSDTGRPQVGAMAHDHPGRAGSRRLRLSERGLGVAVGLMVPVLGLGIAACGGTASSQAATTPSSSATHAAAPGGFGSGSGSNARSTNAAGGSVGTVSSVSSSSFTVSTPTGGKVTVKKTSSTVYKKGTTKATASAVSKGKTVLVLGKVNSTTITASQVIVQPAINLSNASAKVISFKGGTQGESKSVGQIPSDYKQGSGTLVSGTKATKAIEAALTSYAGGVVDRVVQLSNGDFEVHNIGVNWPHHVFVNQDFKVIGAND